MSVVITAISTRHLHFVAVTNLYKESTHNPAYGKETLLLFQNLRLLNFLFFFPLHHITSHVLSMPAFYLVLLRKLGKLKHADHRGGYATCAHVIFGYSASPSLRFSKMRSPGALVAGINF